MHVQQPRPGGAWSHVCIGARAHILLLALVVASRALPQDVLIDDSFDGSPAAAGWVLGGSAVWVPPLGQGQSCQALGLDPNNPFGDGIDDCTLYPSEGYVLVTPGQLWQTGSIFSGQSRWIEDLKLTLEVELRDGTPSPADGLALVIIGSSQPPAAPGSGGGGLGAIGIDADLDGAQDPVPTLSVELDTWCCNAQDEDSNHVQLSWSPVGFPAALGALPRSPPPYQGAVAALDPALRPLNNREPPPASPNRFRLELTISGGAVALDIANDDAVPPLPRTRLTTETLEGYSPFEGFIGVTAATGGAAQNHLLHSVRLEALPAEPCLDPPGAIERSFAGLRDPAEACGEYGGEDLLDVSLRVTSLRESRGPCAPTTALRIVEQLPAGWTASGISDGGLYSSGQRTITWTITTPGLSTGKVLRYGARAPLSGDLSAKWAGHLAELASGAPQFAISGAGVLFRDAPFDACGAIRCWNILGAYSRPGGAAPGAAAIRADYLTDGFGATEANFPWAPGAQVATDLGGASAAAALLGGARGRNPAGVPEVFAYNSTDGLIDLERQAFGGGPDNVMAYAQCYVVNTTGSDVPVYLGVSSDDSIQVTLNQEELWLNSVGRGASGPCDPQDHTWALGGRQGTLHPGENSLVVKVFDGCCDWSFSLRFEDQAGNAITSGLNVRKSPQGACITPPLRATRSFRSAGTASIEGEELPVWAPGEAVEVAIALTEIRGAGAGCPPAGTVGVIERLPPGWEATFASDGGVLAAGQVSWSLTAGSLGGGKTLIYRARAGSSGGDGRFQGRIVEASTLPPFAVGGAGTLHGAGGIAPRGFLRSWLLLGPYVQPPGNSAAPPALDMRRDHLCDGTGTEEITFEPGAGDTVETDYGGCARSVGLAPTLNPALNPLGRPEWHAWSDRDDTIDFTSVYGGDMNGVMAYAVTYLDVDEARDFDIGLASDDSIQVLLDGEEIFLRRAAREAGVAEAIEDVIRSDQTPLLNPLSAGRHRVMVKVFEGSGEHAFRLRLQDPISGAGITKGLSACLGPEPLDCPGKPPEVFIRGDADANRQLEFADVLFTAEYLFLGGAIPPCLASADSNGDGRLNLTDFVSTLFFLYSGGPPPRAYPECDTESHLDPSQRLGCAAYPSPCEEVFNRVIAPAMRLEVEAAVPDPAPAGSAVAVEAVVRVRNTEPDAFPIRGWSLGLTATPRGDCALESPTVAGTLGDLVANGGLRRNSGFLEVGVVDPARNVGVTGVICVVALGFTEPVLLPGNEVPYDLLRVSLKGVVPDSGCRPCRIEFSDGLVGRGGPVLNLIDANVVDYQPFSRPLDVALCTEILDLEPGGPGLELRLPAQSRRAYARLEPPPPEGSVITLSLEAPDPQVALSLRLRWDEVPTRALFDFAADGHLVPSQRLTIPYARAGTAYILVEANRDGEGDVLATLSAVASALSLQGLASSCGAEGCSGAFPITLRGGGFRGGADFTLERGAETIPAEETVVVSDSLVELRFDASGRPEGAYDIVARSGSGASLVEARLEGAVVVRHPRIGPRLEATISLLETYRPFKIARGAIRCANTGDTEMTAPLIELRGPAELRLGFTAEGALRAGEVPRFLGDTLVTAEGARLEGGPLLLLGAHAAGVAGILPPGASVEIPFLFFYPLHGSDQLELEARVVNPGPGRSLSWLDISAPAGLSPSAWTSSIRPAIIRRYGEDALATLSQIATRLGRRGVRPYSVGTLLRFAADEAAGQPASAILGVALGLEGELLRQSIVGAFQPETRALLACTETSLDGSFSLGPLADGEVILEIENFHSDETRVVLSAGDDAFPVVLRARAPTLVPGFGCGVRPEPPQPLVLPPLEDSLLRRVASATTQIVFAEDPNTKDGPEYGRHVAPGEALRYEIQFENVAPEGPSQAAANRILILDPLSPILDANCLKFTSAVLGGSSQVELATEGGGGCGPMIPKEVPLRTAYPPELGLSPEFTVRVEAGVARSVEDLRSLSRSLCGFEDPCDPEAVCALKGPLCEALSALEAGAPIAHVLIQGLVPNTGSAAVGDYYRNYRVGFLPPYNVSDPGRSKGSVTYEVPVKSSAQEDEIIENRAEIIFDDARPYPTPTRCNVVREAGPRFIRGDCNNDGRVGAETGDMIFLLSYNFGGGRRPECFAACDANGDGRFEGITGDAIYLINYFFLGTGPPPPAPYPSCGLGRLPGDAALGCESPAPCPEGPSVGCPGP